jgi:hypothetical protein
MPFCWENESTGVGCQREFLEDSAAVAAFEFVGGGIELKIVGVAGKFEPETMEQAKDGFHIFRSAHLSLNGRLA